MMSCLKKVKRGGEQESRETAIGGPAFKVAEDSPAILKRGHVACGNMNMTMTMTVPPDCLSLLRQRKSD
jgi:hypothetical protein